MKIKKFFIAVMAIFALALLFSGCTSKNTRDTIDWIEDNEKPIVCTKTTFYYMDGDITFAYTMCANDGEYYYSGETYLVLPDTIK